MVSERTAVAPSAHRELRAVARGGTLNLAGFVVAGVLGFVLAIVITRGLGAAGAGVVFGALAVFSIGANVAELGADTGAVRFISRARALDRTGEIRRILTVALVPAALAGAIAGFAMWAGADRLAEWFVGDRQVEGAAFIRALAPFLPFATMATVALAATRGFGTMVPFVAIDSVLTPALKPLLVGTLLAAGLGTTAVATGWGVPEAVACAAAIAALAGLVRQIGPSASAPARSVGAVARSFWRFSAPRGLAAAFQVTVLWIDVLLLGIFRPTAEVGVYAAASRAVMVGTFALQAVRLAIAPQIASLLAREDRDGAQTLYQTATWWLIAVSWPLFLTLACFAPLLLQVFGTSFTSGQGALAILSVAMLVNLGTGNVTVVLLMGGKSSWNLVNTAVAIVLNVGLNLLLIPRFGMEGAAVAWAVSIVVDNLMALAEVWWFLGMRPFGRGYAVVVAAALGCVGGIGLLVRLTVGATVPGLVLFMVAAGAAYGAVLYRWRDTLRFDTFVGALRDGRKVDAIEPADA